MKKTILFSTLILSIFISSCNKDDDGSCETCDISDTAITACDNGDGTVTISDGNESEVLSEEDLDGVSPELFIQFLCSDDFDLGS
ncbi:hypothetical protein H0I23_14185 [Cellulophaga sp. HaHaR_3_176]|uniref:hypothetical protein n=1 Tax=Cellulophaga sp. HaHaR_3_176 TaxID=1942464 RepID=UPI001C1FC2A6|nr:hypothetical protein [Cellulophaga sp. HaHaR_3_176]QWX83588.1 hypothetical protein H0I23_14185 [Cellulophaga sp. HaHaR_3_176]